MIQIYGALGVDSPGWVYINVELLSGLQVRTCSESGLSKVICIVARGRARLGSEAKRLVGPLLVRQTPPAHLRMRETNTEPPPANSAANYPWHRNEHSNNRQNRQVGRRPGIHSISVAHQLLKLANRDTVCPANWL